MGELSVIVRCIYKSCVPLDTNQYISRAHIDKFAPHKLEVWLSFKKYKPRENLFVNFYAFFFPIGSTVHASRWCNGQLSTLHKCGREKKERVTKENGIFIQSFRGGT